METATYRYSESLTFSDLGGAVSDCFFEFVENMAWDPDGKYDHGLNSAFAQQDLIKICLN